MLTLFIEDSFIAYQSHPINVMAASSSSPSLPQTIRIQKVVNPANAFYTKQFESLFGPDKPADVHFVISRKIPGNAKDLSSVSEVFRANFSGDWKDKKEVIIEDIEEGPFRSVMSYIYKDEIEMNMRDLFVVLSTAHRYVIPGLIESLTCPDVFDMNVGQCVWQYLSFAVLSEDNVLKQRCLKMIDRYANQFLQHSDFLAIDAPVIKSFISRDSLEVDELTLFYSCLRWSKVECFRTDLDVTPMHQRMVMEPFIHEIRFPLIPIQNFWEEVEPTEILSSQECISICKAMSNPDSYSGEYKVTSRHGVRDEELLEGSDEENSYHETLDLIENMKCFAAVGYTKNKLRTTCNSCDVTFSPKNDPPSFGICFPCEYFCHMTCLRGPRISIPSSVLDVGSNCSCPPLKCIFFKRVPNLD